MSFILHPRLAADTIPVGELPLSRLLLINDARFPWVVLVPRRDNMREIIDLSAADQAQLFHEMQDMLKAMRSAFTPDKLNLGAIGNIVPQLHLHFIARFSDDAAWPKPIWGFGTPVPYTPSEASEMMSKITAHLEFSQI